ncbi:RNA polymerase subunit sigma-24 [Kribbella sp. ALI-6-A]|uniref:RNA polymerase sigma factor n=1 Tax=Kribbella sp. ALI-6-A TaxID=1933817 RepID=UPI00097C0066|nr:sigma-70 family RNA polymerase sigma factor [Kribbella sp. ALI-6-A]ONI74071.1 RNA polymerase subunit sigma-24 [Kribbella sp. ALI-6-A]
MTSRRPDMPPPAVPPGPSDDELWEALRRCEPAALGELFSRYSGIVHAYAVRHTGSYGSADDAVQATFITAWRQFSRSDPGPLLQDSARAWLLTLARNELRNTTRAKRRLAQFVSRQPMPLHHPDHADTVAARLDSERHIQAVRAALKRLPAHERETVELVYWAELPLAEAAAVLGVAEGTVKARLSRARRRLPALLDHTGPEEAR